MLWLQNFKLIRLQFKRVTQHKKWIYTYEHWPMCKYCTNYLTEAVVQRCSLEKVLWKYAANLQETTHAEVWFQSNFIEIALRHGCSPVNLLHIFRTPFPMNRSGWLLLYLIMIRCTHLQYKIARSGCLQMFYKIDVKVLEMESFPL